MFRQDPEEEEEFDWENVSRNASIHITEGKAGISSRGCSISINHPGITVFEGDDALNYISRRFVIHDMLRELSEEYRKFVIKKHPLTSKGHILF